jgi:hypothetical protein
MFARVTVVQGPADRADEAVKVINDRAVPAAKQIPGLVAAYWAIDRQSGKGVTFAIFDSEESIRASEETARQVREAAVAEVGAKIVSVENYEIVGQA